MFQTNTDPPPICSEDNTHPYLNPDLTDESFSNLNLPITSQEVQESISKIRINKAPGLDKITNEMLKHTHTDIVPFLTKLFQHIFENKLFPTEWTKSVIVPIHKKGDLNNCSNYRPISLTSLLSKIYTFILNKRLTVFVETNNILPIEQAGFRQKPFNN